jgi:hypothetical protein
MERSKQAVPGLDDAIHGIESRSILNCLAGEPLEAVTLMMASQPQPDNKKYLF